MTHAQPTYDLVQNHGAPPGQCPELLWLRHGHGAAVGALAACQSPLGAGHHGACWARVGGRYEGYLVEWWPRHERGEVDRPAQVPARGRR